MITASTSRRFLTPLLGCAIVAMLAGGCVQDQLVNRSEETQKTGIELYNQGQFVDAAGAFRKSIREDPREYESYYYLGSCYDQLGQYQQSIQSYKSGIAVMRETFEGREDTAFRMKLLEAEATAIAKSSDRGAELDALQKSGTAEDFLVMGKVYRNSGDADSAVDTYNRASLMAPENFYIQKDYGLYLEQLGQSKRAEAPLRKAYAINPKDPQVVDALRRIGVVPGPAIKDQKNLAKPPIPQGPIPEVDLSKIGGSSNKPAPAPTPAPQAPRD